MFKRAYFNSESTKILKKDCEICKLVHCNAYLLVLDFIKIESCQLRNYVGFLN